MMIHQLQAIYLMEQDRILVRLNTQAGEEIRLWLTRRMVMKLFPYMVKASSEQASTLQPTVSHDGADSKALAQFNKQESLQKSDFSTPFNAQASALPMGVEPLLATTVHITPAADGALRIGFEEKIGNVTESRSFEITLGQQLLHGFLHLIESALQNADWGISLGDVDALNKTSPEDVFSAAEPPQYLN
jgi:hypothetical protein